MARFTYRALSASGDIVDGEIDGPDVRAVIARLNEQALLPIEAAEKRARPALGLRLSIGRGNRFAAGGLALFMQQLTRLLAASLPVDRALEILTTLLDDRRARRIVQRLLERVRDGASLADAMAADDQAFPKVCVSMVRAGEEGGALRAVLVRVGEFLVRSETIRQKVVSAMIYPAVLMVVAAGAIALILTFVLPQFELMFQDAGASLPVSTRLVMAASRFLRNDWWIILLGGAIAVVVFQRVMQRPAAQALRDRAVLRVPVLRGLVTRYEVSRFSRSLGVLLMNGVPASRALALAGATVGSRVFADAIETLALRFKEGEGLATALEQAGCFPNLAIQLVQIGEETGRLQDMLQEIADIYDQEVERALERLLALLVPAITILMGLIVALIVASVMTAMVSINGLVK
ncbi:type II secretion system F family protein [Acidisphaera rubrifaciens]|nr:type II secretion system F family protein [Acidisphaera rubrifaciens]